MLASMLLAGGFSGFLCDYVLATVMWLLCWNIIKALWFLSCDF